MSAWRYTMIGLLALTAQAAAPEYAALDAAYSALRAKDYDTAIAKFAQAASLAPERADIVKNLAYTYLKIGENELARDRFGDAMRLTPEDQHVALEYAFLCHETKQQAAARRVFDHVRRKGNATAERAFSGIESELLAGIERWSQAVELQPDNFSGHEELARLAALRDDFETATRHYERAWRLRPERRDLLLALGDLWKLAGAEERANAALLAASRGAEPRTAETAREHLPARYPYVYEFEAALALDPLNIHLRREFAYLLLEMGRKEAAEDQFRTITEHDKTDVLSAAQLGFLLLNRGDVTGAMPLLERALASDDEVVTDRVREALRMPKTLRRRPETPRTQTSDEAKKLAWRSLEAGYLKDAEKYLRIAHENDPVDFNVILKLGWTYNLLKDDRQALEWFRLARRSEDPAIAAEAGHAYRNLRAGIARVTSSAWILPFYSSRWTNVFTYAQVKTEYRLRRLPVRLYVSTRYSGDVRGRILDPRISATPQALSESAAIPGVGASWQPWRGATLWGEAGWSFSYLHPQNRGPDYRGGLSYSRAVGHTLGAEGSGFFGEAMADVVFLSRFENDLLLYSQNKFGWTIAPLKSQIVWNWNMTTDARRLAWANTTEQGPGIRFQVPGAPKSIMFSASALQGAYTVMRTTHTRAALLTSALDSGMRFLISLFLLAFGLRAQTVLLLTDESGAWPAIFGAVGMSVTQASDLPPAAAREQVQSGAFGILEGGSAAAESFGITAGPKRVTVRSVVDARTPKLGIVWEKAQDIPVFQLPADAQIFARERWTGAPLMAGLRRGKGALLWLAIKPGVRGYERFPYVLQALADLGMTPPLTSHNLWAFFDSSYRMRVDVDYFAEQWRKAGIAALHVAAWHFNEPDAERDAYLTRLIAACHKRAILVYAWIELPHVSERFWQDHPEWREKTALLQDAHLDWRKLMNLQNPDCFRAVAAATRSLIGRFDWDGVNLAELYFESLEGAANAARFTPMNDDVRQSYKAFAGIDPRTLLAPGADANRLSAFLDWRAALAKGMQSQWLAEIEKARAAKPHLDIVLTHVDDRFDTRMRSLVGADAAAVLPMLAEHDFQFLIEDPATVWHLGPDRYAEIARRYAELTPRRDKLAIDINIVERYQDVYPTKQQTGVELLQLVQVASKAFDRVALYFENSIGKPDWELLPSSGAVVKRYQQSAGKVIVEGQNALGVRWKGGAKVNGRLWPVVDGKTVWLPAGSFVVEPAELPSQRILDFNGDLRTARATSSGIELSYSSGSRALAVLTSGVQRLEIDGVPTKPEMIDERVLALPRGQHLVTVQLATE